MQVGLSYQYKYPTKKQGKTTFNPFGKMDWLTTEEFFLEDIVNSHQDGYIRISVSNHNHKGELWWVYQEDFEESTTEKIKLILS